jgi:hypothetical protein
VYTIIFVVFRGLFSWRFFLCLGGARPLHDAQSLTTRSPVEDPISSSPAFLKIMPDALSFLRRSCHLRPWCIMPLFRLGCARRQFSNVCPLGVLLTTSSLPGPWRPCRLRGAATARRVKCLRAAANFCCDPPWHWVRFFGRPQRLTVTCLPPYRFPVLW